MAFCRGIAETGISDLDMIHDPETDPLLHHEFPETDQRPFSLKKQGHWTLIGRQNENRSRLCETVGSRTENRFIMEEQNMKKWKKIILAVSAILMVTAIVSTVYLIIRQCKTKAIIYS